MTIRTFLMTYPVRTYYGLTFTISWGGFLIAGGPGIFAGSEWKTDPLFPIAVLAMLAGPPIAGFLCTIGFSGKRGLHELKSRLFRWRVGARWYAIGVLTAPLLQLAVLIALSGFSPVFLPAIATAENKLALVVPGIAVGLIGGFVEELGWTGFVIPHIREQHGVFSTGIFVGVLWVVWHLLQMWWVGNTSSEALPLSLFLPLYFVSALAALTAYRILMVWVYDRTKSLLVAVLMHASYIFTTLFVLAPPTTGAPLLIYTGFFAGILWIIVAVAVTRFRAPHAA